MSRGFLIVVLCGSITSSIPWGWSQEKSTSAIAEMQDERPLPVSAGAQLFAHMGPHRRTVTTDSTEAQEYFDQGLTWMYAFNHDEAIRSFLRASELDPHCTMAWWGVAYCEGPNYNDYIMTDDRSKAAWYALQNAVARLEHASPVERALVRALTQRYANPWPEDRTALEQSFADAMAQVWQAYGQDADVGTLYAEAMMVQRPWKLYTIDEVPEEDTSRIVAVLQRVLDMAPNHPGANHLFIHAVEPSDRPAQGLVSARRLMDLVPASGHLLHMPSHIYVQTGRWNEAIVQNQKALRSDAEYRRLSPKQTIQHMYMVHNAHMLAFAAMMSGREREAMAAARAMWRNIPEEVIPHVAAYIDLWMCSVYDVQKRFGRWDDLLDEEAPPASLPITTAIWRAHRAIAYAAKKDFPHAAQEWNEFREAKANIPEETLFGNDLAHTILDVSDQFIGGEIALQQGHWDEAATLLDKGARIEDSLWYGEPPQWLQPIRHTLGAVYLIGKRAEDAERVYREDLAKWPDNGWSLYGLSRALSLQGKSQEAAEVARQYERAWSCADAPTETSCKCIPQT